MMNKTKASWQISENEVTDETIYWDRRNFIKAAGFAGTSLLLTDLCAAEKSTATNSLYTVSDTNRPLTKEEHALKYNNFYEFSLDKAEVSEKVKDWQLGDTWKVEIAGLTDEPKTYDFHDLIKKAGGEEERIYRFRCVEAWSMVLPWTGFAMNKLIPLLKPKASAKFVSFQTFSDKKIGTNMAAVPYYPWPYTEGLTMEEAMHPLAFMATGLYGKKLPKQNGAPIRAVLPWKYGFKSIKSIVKIEFMDHQPKTLWNQLAPKEYGFYANVNPTVDHPRWSQATERVINGNFFPTRIPTLMFNGYEKEVAGLYKGLDLKKNY